MGIMDFEVQRERRTELLREAKDRHSAGDHRAGNRHKKARGFWKLAGAWVIGR